MQSKVKNINQHIIKSPLNYLGGKHRLLPQIMPFFPKEISLFVDLFCGGATVGINVNTEKVILNDIDTSLIGLYQFFKDNDENYIFTKIFEHIDKFNLSRTDIYGYSFYNCNSSDGLARFNKDKFIALRECFNTLSSSHEDYFIILYILIVYAFNNQIRFNIKGKFNLPCGKRDFNKRMQDKLLRFIKLIKTDKFSLKNQNFSNVFIENRDNNTFVYADPPYLITCATYNEQNKWNESMELELLRYLDELNERNIRFALSNVLTSKGKENTILKDWISTKNYKCISLQFDYSNSNYQTKNREKNTEEVLIINY